MAKVGKLVIEVEDDLLKMLLDKISKLEKRIADLEDRVIFL